MDPLLVASAFITKFSSEKFAYNLDPRLTREAHSTMYDEPLGGDKRSLERLSSRETAVILLALSDRSS